MNGGIEIRKENSALEYSCKTNNLGGKIGGYQNTRSSSNFHAVSTYTPNVYLIVKCSSVMESNGPFGTEKWAE